MNVNYNPVWRQLFFPFFLFRFFNSIAGQVQLLDNAVMHQSVNGRRCSHWIFEDAFPLREGQIEVSIAAQHERLIEGDFKAMMTLLHPPKGHPPFSCACPT